MAKSLIQAWGATTASTANTTQYWGIGGKPVPTTTEANVQEIFRTAGTLSRLSVRVTANTVASNSTARTRKTAANGGQTATITASTTGMFQDTTNTDTVAAADKFDVQTVPGAATNTYSISLIALVFAATTDTVTNLTMQGTGANISSASVTVYQSAGGSLGIANTAEDNQQVLSRKAGTMKNMNAFVSANARTTTTTMTSRKNLAAGAMTFNYTSTQTGLKEDTVNTDTVAAGDKCAIQVAGGTGTQTLTFTTFGLDFVSTGGFAEFNNAYSSAAVTRATSLTHYFGIAGDGSAVETTEANAQLKTLFAGTLSELVGNVTSNAITANSSLTVRKGTADSTQTVTITASTAGYYNDSTHTTLLAVDDLINYKLVTGGTGTTLNIRAQTTIMAETTSQAITKTLTETVTVSESLARLANKGRKAGDVPTYM